MFKFRSKAVFISALLGTLYSIYLITYFTGAIAGSQGAEQAGAAIATALVTPHMALVVLATIFSWFGFFANNGLGSACGRDTLLCGRGGFPRLLPFCRSHDHLELCRRVEDFQDQQEEVRRWRAFGLDNRLGDAGDDFQKPLKNS